MIRATETIKSSNYIAVLMRSLPGLGEGFRFVRGEALIYCNFYLIIT